MARLTLVKPAPHHPTAGLSVPATSHSRRKRTSSPRGLTEKQLKNPFIRSANERWSGLMDPAKQGKWLRRLDNIHASGRRSRSELWCNLAAIAGPVLARLDIATLACGWYGDDGIFCLNTQGGIAEDARLRDWQLSRLFAALERAGYLIRRSKAVWVAESGQTSGMFKTRMLIMFTPLFFRDLGLGWQLERAQNKALIRRQRQMSEVATTQAARTRLQAEDKVRRTIRRARYAAGSPERASQTQFDFPQSETYLRALHDLRLELRLLHADWSAEKVNAEAEQAINARYG